MRPSHFRILLYVVFAGLSSILFTSRTYAQFPEGGPMPLSTVNKDEIHSSFRFGYNANDSLYKYPGEYRADGNFFADGRSSFYGLADIFIESRLKAGEIFAPSRLWGTFELGGRTTLSHDNYIDVFIRHQSAHDVDSTTDPDSMWEYVGGRYRHSGNNYDVWASAAYYTRRIYVDYSSDFEAHADWRHGYLFGRPVALDGDIHYVGEQNGPELGFLDYAIEPSLYLNKHMAVYVDYGQLHDEDQPNGKFAIPVIVGAKVDL